MVPAIEKTDALFVDFDGTLVEIAAEPGLVEVSDALLSLLDLLEQHLGGALAVISGRPVEDLDLLLAPLRFAAAGEHGAEIRTHASADITHSSKLPQRVLQAAEALADGLPGTLLELKTASVSLHYRKAPAHEEAVKAGMFRLLEGLPGYELLEGKMVVELKPAAANKGDAIRQLMRNAPFSGRRSFFIGDDTTDEAGFAAVNEAGGISIRVGDRLVSGATYKLSDVTAVHRWLESCVPNSTIGD